MQEYQHVTHTFEPVFNKESKILILGSFPSVKSRENNFYYGHPQNRFWKVLAKVFEVNVPQTIEEKKAFLLENHIAVWDVIESCTIIGSSDTSIRDVVVNDFSRVLANSSIERIYVNGTKAYDLYQKYAKKQDGIPVVKLPSTSPANAAWSVERLCGRWKEIAEHMG
ncbi:MAG: DNA-deoxyinosine glycosylase [Agathobacter sp.]|nr:DNA-deoxyinosine glycosylase [Agathobacter sp.]